jgi:hypothetical protein
VLETAPASTYVYQSGTSAPGYVLPNPITVTPNPVSFGVPVTLRLKAYNYALSTYTDSGAITCTGPSGNKTLTSTDTNGNRLAGKQATCKNYAVSAVSVNGVAVTGPFPVASTGTPGTPNGSLTEYTTISLPAINANDVVGLTLSSESDYLPAATCTYVAADLTGAGGWKNNGNPTVLPGACTP